MHTHNHTTPHHNPKFGCLRCKAGFTGTIKNWGDENCREYDQDLGECKICAPKYYYLSANDACTEIVTTAALATGVPANYANCE